MWHASHAKGRSQSSNRCCLILFKSEFWFLIQFSALMEKKTKTKTKNHTHPGMDSLRVSVVTIKFSGETTIQSRPACGV